MVLEILSSFLALGILFLIIFIFGGIIFGSLFLMLSANIFGVKKTFLPSIKIILISMVTSVILNFLSFNWVLGILFSIGTIIFLVYLIKRFFEVGIGKSIGIFLVWVFLGAIIAGIIITVSWTLISSVLMNSV